MDGGGDQGRWKRSSCSGFGRTNFYAPGPAVCNNNGQPSIKNAASRWAGNVQQRSISAQGGRSSATLPLTRMRHVLDLSCAHTAHAQMAFSKLSAASSLLDHPPKPVHPHSRFVFTKREFGKKQVVKRSCQASWFSTWPWLYYQANDPDDVYFVMCVCFHMQRVQ